MLLSRPTHKPTNEAERRSVLTKCELETRKVEFISDSPDLPKISKWRDLALDAKVLGFALLLAGLCWIVTYFFNTS